MKLGQTYQINALARLSGVSVRTLRHYDQIGLLTPRRSRNGYRLYADSDLLRLQQILIQRELGLALEDIRKALDDPNFDARAALLQQKELLQARARAMAQMLRAVEAAIAHLNEKGNVMANIEDMFGGFDPAKHEAEAKARWGESDAYKESAQRTKNYSGDDWKALKVEQDNVYREAARLMEAGIPADDKDAMNAAEQHRLLIDRWFYPLSADAHCKLADMYEADARFAESINAYGKDLTRFLASAIRANARRR